MRRRDERGAVTAEAAVVLPVLVLVTVALAWLVSLGVAQVRVVDASREAARALARGESQGTAVALARRVAPGGASVRTDATGTTVRSVVVAPVRGPGGVFGALPTVRVRAEAVALKELGT
ncbi:TadE family type IV pilus minor pilin [Marmoricola endophyticus]|uniref:TadE family type IV pilus minor pilin n=1 Tax=Marmoricola endophyticus TaxID=2040280 RepID=UPI001E467D18|nr:TadE family type IV pilus minor pilin [Marmoricola endophyticus]